MDNKKISELRELWLKGYNDNKEYVDKRICEGIEKNKKGYCKLLFKDENGQPLKNKKVNINQVKHDFKYGANMFLLDEFKNEEDNQKYRKIFKEYFNLGTVPFYWYTLEPEQGKPRYSVDSPKIYRRPAPDLCVEYCEESGIDAKLHCLVYNGNGFLPSWLPQDDMNAAEEFYENRFREISERYSGRMMEFEVINETLCQDLDNTPNIINKKDDLVEWSFKLARKYFPNETLVINEAQPLQSSVDGYRNRYYMQLQKCLSNGAEIDKIGVQHHLFTGRDTRKNDEAYEAEIRKDAYKVDPMVSFRGLDIYKNLGLPIEFTEVTIPSFGNSEEDEDFQAEILKLMFSVWFSHESVDTIVYWNTVEGHCFFNENNCYGALFHNDLSPKKSAIMLKKLFTEIWHTDLELTTDENGAVEFRGFYGNYTLSVDGKTKEFGIHKFHNNVHRFSL